MNFSRQHDLANKRFLYDNTNGKQIGWDRVFGYVLDNHPPSRNLFDLRFCKNKLVFSGTELKTSYVSNGVRTFYFNTVGRS